MKRLTFLIVWTVLLALVLTVFAIGSLRAADPPGTTVFDSKLGNVTFDHAKHVEREAECTACHD